MVVTKKRGRPAGSKNKPKDPMIVAVEKRGGRPAGTRVKHRQTVDSVRAEWEAKYRDLLMDYEALVNAANSDMKALVLKVNNLEHQAIGYKAVVSYLENVIERTFNNSVRGN